MIEDLEIHAFRNIPAASIKFDPHVNLIYGKNGSGKTSLLEAIYYLGMARSFRTRHHEQIIQLEQPLFSLFANIEDMPVGLRRSKNGDLHIRINKEDVKLVTELASILPLQLINHDAFDLLNAGPKERRHFVDWGLFHVSRETFLPAWRKLARVLKQRNAALKTKNLDLVKTWDFSLVELSEEVNSKRKEYLENWLQELQEVLSEFKIDATSLKIDFYSGWNAKKTLGEVLQESAEKDLLYGSTQFGAHKADIKIETNNMPAQAFLSRGQQKLLICAMKIAQAVYLTKESGKSCIFLIDDLPAELDEQKRREVCSMLIRLKTQVFLTGIEKKQIKDIFHGVTPKIFHIKSGEIFVS